MDNPIPELITNEIVGGSMLSLGSTLVLGSVLRKIIPVPVIPELASGIIVGFANPIPHHRISSLSGSAIAFAILLASKSEADSKAIEKDDYSLKTTTRPRPKRGIDTTTVPKFNNEIKPTTPKAKETIPSSTEDIEKEISQIKWENIPLFEGEIPKGEIPSSVTQILFVENNVFIRVNPANPYDFALLTLGSDPEETNNFTKTFTSLDGNIDEKIKYIRDMVEAIASSNLRGNGVIEIHILKSSPIINEFESLIQEIMNKYSDYEWLRYYYSE